MGSKNQEKNAYVNNGRPLMESEAMMSLCKWVSVYGNLGFIGPYVLWCNVWRVKEPYNEVTLWNSGIIPNQSKPNSLDPTVFFVLQIPITSHYRSYEE